MALAIALAVCTFQVPAQQARPVTDNPELLYPQWLRPEHLFRTYLCVPNSEYAVAKPAEAVSGLGFWLDPQAIAVNRNGRLFIVVTHPDKCEAPGGLLYLLTDSDELSGATGLSVPSAIPDALNVGSSACTVGPDDNLHVVWIEIVNLAPSGTVLQTLRHRKLDLQGPTPAWSPTITEVWEGLAIIEDPSIAVDHLGHIYIGFLYQDTQTVGPPLCPKIITTRKILLSIDLSPATPIRTVTETNNYNCQGGCTFSEITAPTWGLRLRPHPWSNGGVQLAWVEETLCNSPPSPPGTFLWHQVRSAVDWQLEEFAVQTETNPPPNGGFIEGMDLAVDSGGSRHLVADVWFPTGQTKLYYSPPGGVWTPVPTATDLFPSGTTVEPPSRIEVDSIGRPHVIWTMGPMLTDPPAPPQQPHPDYGWMTIGYGTREPGSGWQIQEPIRSPQQGKKDFANLRAAGAAISPTDAIHLLVAGTGHGLYYMRTLEYNLGDQDPLGEIAVAPNTSVQVTTGNLGVSIPFFETDGVGINTRVLLGYDSQNDRRGIASQGWQIMIYRPRIVDHTVRVKETGERLLTLHWGDGRYAVFRFNADYGFAVPDAEFIDIAGSAKLYREPSFDPFVEATGFTLEKKSGAKWHFDGKGLPKNSEDGHPDNTLELTHTEVPSWVPGVQGRVLTKIKDTANRETKLNYVGDRLASIVDPADHIYFLQYLDDRLAKVVFPDDATWSFTYGPKGLLSSIAPPEATASGKHWSISYYPADGRVKNVEAPEVMVVQADGTLGSVAAVRSFTYTDPEPSSGTGIIDDPSVKYTSGLGIPTVFKFERRRSVVTEKDDTLGNEEKRTYHGFPGADNGYRNLKSVTDKNGNTTTYEYYASGALDYPHVKTLLKSVTDACATIEYTYTNLNQVATVKNGRGFITINEYNAFGDLTNVTHPNGNFELWDNDSHGRVLKYTLPTGGEESYSYGLLTPGLPTAILRPEHNSPEKFEYNALGRRTKSTTAKGAETTYEYNNRYWVVKTTGPQGDGGSLVTSTKYNLDGKVTGTTGPKGTSVTTYNALGYPIEIKNEEGGVTSFFYDAEGNRRKVKDPKGYTTETVYDPLNRVIEQIEPGLPPRTVLFARDGNGSETNVTEAGTLPNDAPRVTSHFYDARNRLIKTIYADQKTTLQKFYDCNDNPVYTCRLYNNNFMSGSVNVYDVRDRVVQSAQLIEPLPETILNSLLAGSATVSLPPNASTNLIEYDANSNVTNLVNAVGGKTGFHFDKADRRIETLNHAGNVVSKRLPDDDDYVSALLRPDPVTGTPALVTLESFSRTLAGEIKTVSNGLGEATVYSYNQARELTQAKDPLGGTTTLQYDNIGRPKSSSTLVNVPTSANWPPLDKVAFEYDYDENGNLTNVIDAMNRPYAFSYTPADQLGAIAGPLNAIENIEYNEFGQVVKVTDPCAGVTENTFNALGQLVAQVAKTNGVIVANRLFTYDGNGWLVKAEETVHKIIEDWGYDPRGWKTNESLTIGDNLIGSISYRHDAAGRVTNQVDNIGQEFVKTYDNDGRPISVTRNGVEERKCEYDAAGRLRKITPGNGVVIVYSYDGAGRWVGIKATQPDGTVVAEIQQKFDAVGNVIEKKYDAGLTGTFNYLPGVGWLAKEEWTDSSVSSVPVAKVFTREYDAAANCVFSEKPGTNFTYVVDAANQLLFQQEVPVNGISLLAGTPVVSSTRVGYNTGPLSDALTPDTIQPSGAWRSQSSSGPQFAGETWFGLKRVSAVEFWMPTILNPVEITNVTVAGSNLTISWTEGAGPYVVQKKATLNAAAWSDVLTTANLNATVSLSGNAMFLQVVDKGSAGGIRFRLKAKQGGTLQPVPIIYAQNAEPLGDGTWKTVNGERMTKVFCDVETDEIGVQQIEGQLSAKNEMRLNELRVYPGALNTVFVTNTYNACGLPTERITFGAGSQVELFTYNDKHQLTGYQNGGDEFVYLFSATVRRVVKHKQGTAECTVYLYDGPNIHAEFTMPWTADAPGPGPATVTATRLNGPSIGSVWAKFIYANGETGQKLYYISDQLGSHYKTLDEAGLPKNTFVPTAFGEPLFVDEQIQDDHLFAFAGLSFDPESGYYFAQARTYDGQRGRFLEPEPLHGRLPRDGYVWAGNRPTSSTDPTGLQSREAEDQESKTTYSVVRIVLPLQWDRQDEGPYFYSLPAGSDGRLRIYVPKRLEEVLGLPEWLYLSPAEFAATANYGGWAAPDKGASGNFFTDLFGPLYSAGGAAYIFWIRDFPDILSGGGVNWGEGVPGSLSSTAGDFGEGWKRATQGFLITGTVATVVAGGKIVWEAGQGTSQWYLKGYENDKLWRALKWVDKLKYEVGQKTLSPEKWAELMKKVQAAGKSTEFEQALLKGRIIIREEGWIKALLPDFSSSFVSTIGTGPTPFVRYVVKRIGQTWVIYMTTEEAH